MEKVYVFGIPEYFDEPLNCGETFYKKFGTQVWKSIEDAKKYKHVNMLVELEIYEALVPDSWEKNTMPHSDVKDLSVLKTDAKILRRV